MRAFQNGGWPTSRRLIVSLSAVEVTETEDANALPILGGIPTNGAMNTWFLEVLGTDGGVRFSTAEPKTLWRFERAKGQYWKRTELGFEMPFKTITGGIFEVGFPDLIQQMWRRF